MKSINKILIYVLTGGLLTGCMSDPKDPHGPRSDSKTVTFALPGVTKAPITYAIDSEAGEDVLSSLDIYMFDVAEGTLEKIFRTSEIDLSSNTGNVQNATVDVTECIGAKKFFLVGNGNGITSSLGNIRYGETTIAQFAEKISDRQATLPVTPLLMTGSTVIDDIVAPNADQCKIRLTRRVARFDVDNDKTLTNFTVARILVSNVNQQAHIFGEALNKTATMASATVDPVAFGTQTDANTGRSKSIFYTCPTTIGTGKTELSIEGTFRDETGERLFTFKPADDFSIEPNKRYTLKVEPISINKVDVEMKVVEWEAADEEIVTEPESNLIGFSQLTLASGDGTLSGREIDGTAVLDVTKATKDCVLKFYTTSTRAIGSDVSVVYTSGDDKILPLTIDKKPAIVTYGGAKYEHHYEITVPFNQTVAPEEIIVDIYNAYDPIQSQSFTVKRDLRPYPGTTHLPVKVGGIWWAPVNVGQTVIEGTDGQNTATNTAGLCFQWGRTNDGWPIIAQDNSIPGPIPYNTATNASNKNIFIKRSTAAGTTSDWVDPQDNTLWDSPEKQPCPTGWRIPLAAEGQLLLTANAAGKTTRKANGIDFEGDTGETLHFNYTNMLKSDNGILHINHTQFYVHCWCSDLKTPASVAMPCIRVLPAGVDMIEIHRAYGISIRCVAIR